METQIIKVTEWANLDTDPINCPQGHTSIERGAKSTGSGYWCSECQLRYVYEIILSSLNAESKTPDTKRLDWLEANLTRIQEMPVKVDGERRYGFWCQGRLLYENQPLRDVIDLARDHETPPSGNAVDRRNKATNETTTNEYTHEDARDREDEQRAAAIEATWKERQGEDYGSY